MKKTHMPLIGLLLVALVAIAAVNGGPLMGNGDRVAEAGSTSVETPSPVADETQLVANCRYGTALEKYSGLQMWTDDLGAGWWLDFQANYSGEAPNDAEYAHVIWVEQDKDKAGNYLETYVVMPTLENDGLGRLLLSRPGKLWIIGNEVERAPDPGQTEGGQGDTMPAKYAEIYHRLYHYIKQWDPTALVAPSALIQFTPGRAQYLDIVWDTYMRLYDEPMPVDVWNMHLYILPEIRNDGTPSLSSSIALGTDPSLAMMEYNGDIDRCEQDNVYCMYEHDDPGIFAAQVRRMRRWMRDHGYRNTPLIISEYSILYPYEWRPDPEGCWVKDELGKCFTPHRVRDYMAATTHYLETATDHELGFPGDNNRLVQQWLWYSIHRQGLGQTSNLLASSSEPLRLTPAGAVFSEATRAEPAHVNLIAAEPTHKNGTINPNGTVSARIGVTVRNNGNTRLNQPVTVTFYRDKALKQVIGSETIPAPSESTMGLTGCAVRSFRIEMDATWPAGMQPVEVRYWAKVDSTNSVSESSEADNVTSGFVLQMPHDFYVPLVTD